MAVCSGGVLNPAASCGTGDSLPVCDSLGKGYRLQLCFVTTVSPPYIYEMLDDELKCVHLK